MKKVFITILFFISFNLLFAGNTVNLDNSSIFKAAALNDIEILEAWVHAGKDVNIKDRLGNTPLLIAAENGSNLFIEYILDFGADTSIQNESGYTPMLAAVSNNQISAALILESFGADPEIANMYGTSTKSWLMSNGVSSVSALAMLDSVKNESAVTGPNAIFYLTKWQRMYFSALAGKKYEEAADLLYVYAHDGEAEAAEIYGLNLYNNSDYEAALPFLLVAANSGFHKSMRAAGIILKDSGRYNEAYPYFCEAVEYGSLSSIADCGQGWLEGYIGGKDYDKAIAYFEEGRALGSYRAVYFIGLMKFHGLGMEQNRTAGLIDIQLAASHGSVEAANELKAFATEEALFFISKYRAVKRSYMRTYLTSQGAVLENRTNLCDTYTFEGYFNPDYGVKYIKICYPEGSDKIMTVGQNPSISSKYKRLLADFVLNASASVQEVD